MSLNVVHVNASNERGGAARACKRLDRALRRAGISSEVLHDSAAASDVDLLRRIDVIQRRYVWENRTRVSDTHFSLSLAGNDLSAHPLVAQSDVVHLHWVASSQTPASLRRLLDTGKPVVWTLHDQAPFTGGCHYSAGCMEFRSTCSNCPQLSGDPFRVTAAVLQDKIALLADQRLTVVAPSSWIADQARSSAVFGPSARIEIIPNGVDMDVFRPRPRADARAAFDLAPDATYILCGADQSERRKGYESLVHALARLVDDERLRGRKLRVLWVGDTPRDGLLADLPVDRLGRIDDDDRLALAYAAADTFVLSSLEDNLPNMLLEAMACGTPVVAYAVGGVVDVVDDRVNGHRVVAGDDAALADAIASLLSDPAEARAAGDRARETVRRRFSASLLAEHTIALYEDLLRTSIATPRIEEARQTPVDPGPAVAVLLDSLAAHCLSDELLDLQRHARSYDRERMVALHAADHKRRAGVVEAASLPQCLASAHAELAAQRERLEELETERARLEEAAAMAEGEAAARLVVIEELKDHWERAEAECAARLELITRLVDELRQRRGLFRTIAAARRAVRLDDWWYSKIPPLLAVAYLQALVAHVSSTRLAEVLPCALLSIVCVAAYGHVMNDIFDVEADRRAGKANAMANVGAAPKWIAAVGLALTTFAPTPFVSYGTAGVALLLTNLLLPTVYSLPRIRLKERGALALVCDAFGSHLAPTAFLLTLLSTGAGWGSHEIAFAALALLWAAALGIKGIIHHQLEDRDNDIASDTVTFATSSTAGQIERWLPRYNLFVEIPVSASFALVVLDTCPLATVAFLAYGFVELLKYRLGFQFALNPEDPRTIRASFPFVNEAFYVLWLPLAAAVQLALVWPAWLWLPLVQSAFFARTLRAQLVDLRAVALAAKHGIGKLSRVRTR